MYIFIPMNKMSLYFQNDPSCNILYSDEQIQTSIQN